MVNERNAVDPKNEARLCCSRTSVVPHRMNHGHSPSVVVVVVAVHGQGDMSVSAVNSAAPRSVCSARDAAFQRLLQR